VIHDAPELPIGKSELIMLVMIQKGKAVHVVNNQSFPISAGDVFVINGKLNHSFKQIDALTLISVVFDPVELNMDKWDIGDLPGFRPLFLLEPEYHEPRRYTGRLELNGNEMRKTQSIITRLEDEINNKNPGFKMDAKAIFIRLLIYLSRCYQDSARTNPHTMSLMRVAKAIEYLDKHFLDDINYHELSHIAGMSQRHFQRVFRHALDCGARQYVIRLRIRKAMQMLRETALSVSEISFECGFEDSNYFSRMFRKYSGSTPLRYRQVESEINSA
jgi:AraC-like DNA-binding protein